MVIIEKTINGNGPYQYHVTYKDGRHHWVYLGKPGGSGDEPGETSVPLMEDSGLSIVEQVLGTVEGEKFRTKMKVEVDEKGNLNVESQKGNKSFLGIANGFENGELDLDIVAYQRGATKDRASGETQLKPGDIIKTRDWTHSGKNSKERFAIYDGEGLVSIEKADAQEIEYRRHNEIAEGDAFVRTADEFGVNNSRGGDGWVQRVRDYDPAKYQYNWDSKFENGSIALFGEGEVVRTSKDEFFVADGGELREINEEEAKELAKSYGSEHRRKDEKEEASSND